MEHYMLDFATIDDLTGMPAYVGRARRMIRDFGGELVVRGRFLEAHEGTLEPSGRIPTTTTVIRWPDRATLDRALGSSEFAELRKIRSQFSTATIAILQGFEDVSDLTGDRD